MNNDTRHAAPQLSYPCQWLYKVIGRGHEELNRAAAEIFGNTPCAVSPSNISKTGKYVSLNIEVTVTDEAERNAFYMALKEHPVVKIVL